MNILFLAAEAYPFIKIGGLADVAGALPGAIRSLNSGGIDNEKWNVQLVIPFYGRIKNEFDNFTPLVDFQINKKGHLLQAHVYKSDSGQVPVYFIDGDPISTEENVYSSNGEKNKDKFAFFSIAALELCRILNWKVDIIHANDWHTSLSLFVAKTNNVDGFFEGTGRILTIHNLPYLGGEGGDIFKDYGINEIIESDLPVWARKQFLPMGIWAADRIVAVSDAYSKEIMTPEYSCGLHEYLDKRRDNISGIINGLDGDQWDPATDKYLPFNFNIIELDKRKNNKEILQKELDLTIDPSVPLIGMVTRIDFQKGIDLAIKSLQTIVELPWQFVLLGTGDPNLETELKQFQAKFPHRVRILLKYDNEMSHKIYGGADIFLMPSRFEPCGISQMISMHYGCIPVVHATGGLKDTVDEEKTGFLFYGSDPDEQAKAIKKAIYFFSNQDAWRVLQSNGMQKDFSWKNSARKYTSLYKSLIQNQSFGGRI